MAGTVIGVIGVLLVLLTPLASGADAPSFEERAAVFDRVSKEPDGDRIVVGHISRALGVSVEKLRLQHTQTGLGWGDLLIAHRIAKAASSSVDEIVAESRNGKTWDAIARDRNVDVQKLMAEVQRSQDAIEQRVDDKGKAPPTELGNRPDSPRPGPSASPPSPGATRGGPSGSQSPGSSPFSPSSGRRY
jgi:hypothetical protein